jgi:plastocyanin
MPRVVLVVGVVLIIMLATAATAKPCLNVEVRDGSYIPRVLSAQPGATVTFTNVGSHAHTVDADCVGGPQIGKLEPKQSCQWTVPADACPGTRYYYHCTYHGKAGDGTSLGSGMAGAIVIGKVAGPAVEGQTLIGPTGGAFLPTSDVLEMGVTDLAVDWYDTESTDTIPVRLLAGVGYGTEIGGVYEFNSDNDVWGANFKYVYPIFNNQPLSLGGLYLDMRDSDLTAYQAYLVHTHTFTKPEAAQTFRATLGVNWTQIDSGPAENDEFRIFGGADFTFACGLTIGAEVQSADSDLGDDSPLSSVYARYRFNDRLRAEVGYTNGATIGVLGADDHNIFAGLSYALGHEPYRLMGEGGSYGY